MYAACGDGVDGKNAWARRPYAIVSTILWLCVAYAGRCLPVPLPFHPGGGGLGTPCFNRWKGTDKSRTHRRGLANLVEVASWKFVSPKLAQSTRVRGCDIKVLGKYWGKGRDIQFMKQVKFGHISNFERPVRESSNSGQVSLRVVRGRLLKRAGSDERFQPLGRALGLG